MFNKNWIPSIREWAADNDEPMLSVYLNVDPSHETNLNQGYLTRFKAAVRSVAERLAHDEAALEQFEGVAEALEKELQDYKPDAKALVIFRTPDGRDWRRGVRVNVRETVAWSQSPALEPLVEMLDEHERYGVALVDKGRARLFVAHLGEIEEVQDLFADDVGHIRTTGTDYRWSEASFHRRVDQHVRRHAQEVAQALAKLDQERGFDRVLLLGGFETRDQVAADLSKRLQRKLAGSVALSILASPREVLETVAEVHAEVERSEELELVSRMMTAAAKNGQAVAGLQPTVQALSQGRIRELVLSGNYHPHWDELKEPALWLHQGEGAADDLLERLLHQTIETGGRVEMVWGPAAESLEKEAGGIGAMLRY
jgi:peptide subunit release factor 1 (eRF1)